MKEILVITCWAFVLTLSIPTIQAASVNNDVITKYLCLSRPDGFKMLVPGSCSQYYSCQSGKTILNSCPHYYDSVNKKCVSNNPGCMATTKEPLICQGPCCGIADGNYAVDTRNQAVYYLCKSNCVAEKKCCPSGQMFDVVKLECGAPATCNDCTTPKPLTTTCSTRTTTICSTIKSTTTTTACNVKPIITCSSPTVTTTCITTTTSRITTPRTSTTSTKIITTTSKPTTTARPKTTTKTSIISTKTSKITTASSTTTTRTTAAISTKTTTTCITTTLYSSTTTASTKTTTTTGTTTTKNKTITTTSPTTTKIETKPSSTTCTTPSKPTTNSDKTTKFTTTTCSTTTCSTNRVSTTACTTKFEISALAKPLVAIDSTDQKKLQNYIKYYAGIVCSDKPDGFFFASISSCNEYFICSHGEALLMSCGKIYFNALLGVCDFPKNTNCIQP